jgi:ubiquinone biosynthesis protein Coq4
VDINSSSVKKNKHSFTHTVLDKYNAQSKGVVPEEVFDALVRNETGMYGTLGSLIKHSQFTDKHADELMKKFEGNQFVQDEIIKQMNSKKQQPITPSQY